MFKYLLDRPVAVTMAMLVAVVLGFVSIGKLPVSLIPETDIPYITVQIRDRNLSAREIDETVANVLRRQFLQVNGIGSVTAESRDGIGTIKLTFTHGTDMDYVFVEVNEMIDRCMQSFPDMDRPKAMKASASDIPVFYINLTSAQDDETSFTGMSRFARDIVARRLEQLEEVAMVDVSGYEEEQILIVPDLGILSRMGITVQQFEKAVTSSDIHLGPLAIRDGQYRYNVKFLSEVSSARDISEIWFRCGERLLQIKDIATVEQMPASRSGSVRSDGRRAISMAVIKQSDARMSDLRRSMDRMMKEFSNDYPSVEFTVTRDQTRLLEYSISNLFRNIIAGILLACIVIFFFMRDFRSPALVCMTMPIALMLSMAVFHLFGLTINIISLSGLLLGVGMMADNTIILVDNITARWQRQGTLREAVISGTREVAMPMLSSVLTTCAVFIPLVFLSGIAGELFRDQAIAVTIVLLSSYLVTVTVIPVYYLWWYRKHTSFRPNRFLERISPDRALKRFDRKVLDWMLDHRFVAWCILAVSLCATALAIVFIPRERLPELTASELIMDVDWNAQLSLEENERRVSALEDIISDECTQITSLVGMQNYLLGHSGDTGTGECSVYFSCKDAETVEKVRDILSNAIAAQYPSAIYSFRVSGNIFDAVFADNEAPLEARIHPVSLPRVEVGSLRELLGSLRTVLPGIRIEDVPVKQDVLFIADPQLMALYGASHSELTSLLKNSLNGNRLFSVVQGTRTLPVVSGSGAGNLEEILEGKFIIKEDREIPVSELMRRTSSEDLKTIVSGPEGNYYPLELHVPQSEIPSVIRKVDDCVRRDGRYGVIFGGSWFSSGKMVGELALVLLVALVLLYLILASQFESLVQPLLILSEILVDIAASLLVLWVMGLSINLMSLIGLVVTSGIVINDSILKVDSINRLRREGMDLRSAVSEASGRRMKAIIMTSLTTILAVCPFLGRGSMGADLQYPMSVVIIIGMVAGTLVSLFVLPALYYSIYRKNG
ncbi:MAG: efflux RND transporter permease subunit [Bacteroidales bacterium]|nr:efflux RND transporter permease subunit [Bacteroidales bacterium]